MKNAAKILATLAIIFLITGEVEAADFKINSRKILVEQKRIVVPIKIPRRFEKPPQKFYTPRQPVRPKPHYIPSRPPPPPRDISDPLNLSPNKF